MRICSHGHANSFLQEQAAKTKARKSAVGCYVSTCRPPNHYDFVTLMDEMLDSQQSPRGIKTDGFQNGKFVMFV